MELAASIEIPISEFWIMTPYELSIAIRGFYRRKESEAEEYKIKYQQIQKDIIYNAYLVSRWVWTKRVDIEKILDIKSKNKEMTDDEIFNVVKQLSLQHGGDIFGQE